jgi:hypothetical protein
MTTRSITGDRTRRGGGRVRWFVARGVTDFGDPDSPESVMHAPGRRTNTQVMRSLPSVIGGVIGTAAIIALAAYGLAVYGLRGTATTVSYAAAKEAGVTEVRTTRDYLIVLNVVPPEHMYQPAAARRLHPTEGELNIRGTMAPITPDARHFEAHIYSLATGRPVHGAHPTITVVDHTAHTSEQVRVTIMQDVVVGARDYHYGNNANMAYGHDFTITVSLNGERAVYPVHLT